MISIRAHVVDGRTVRVEISNWPNGQRDWHERRVIHTFVQAFPPGKFTARQAAAVIGTWLASEWVEQGHVPINQPMLPLAWGESP